MKAAQYCRLVSSRSSASLVSHSWLFNMSAKRFAVSADSQIAGMSSTTGTFIVDVSQTIQPFLPFER
jgi:hypothetical protein